MAGKSAFTPEEWKTLVESAMMAAIAVTAADPSGLWGTLKESMASARTIMGAAHDSTAAELVRVIASEYETADGRTIAREGLRAELSGKKPAEIVTKALEVIKKAADLVDAKAPGDAAAYKTWLQHIAQAVAEASSEGGFLGFGGVQVSETEKATLAHIKESLGIAPS
ncbi:MAG TPA: hypothetical protein VEK34_16055 [Methylocella sp.]|nr:hypothetical protein [Methylocella sp.]